MTMANRFLHDAPVPHVRRLLAAAALLAGAALVAGCAGTTTPRTLAAGASEAEVVATMGRVTGRYAFTEGGYRLEFARGPQGRETWMIDFDASGRMVDAEQVMDLWYLTRIMPDMTTLQVLSRVGHPGEVRHNARQQLSVWSYRYPTNDCLWFLIEVGDDGRVISGSTAIDPQCDAGGMRAGMSAR